MLLQGVACERESEYVKISRLCILPVKGWIDLGVYEGSKRICGDFSVDAGVVVGITRDEIPCPGRGLYGSVYLLRRVIGRNREACKQKKKSFVETNLGTTQNTLYRVRQ